MNTFVNNLRDRINGLSSNRFSSIRMYSKGELSDTLEGYISSDTYDITDKALTTEYFILEYRYTNELPYICLYNVHNDYIELTLELTKISNFDEYYYILDKL